MAPRVLLICAVVAVVSFVSGLLVGRAPGPGVRLDLRHTPGGGGTEVATFSDDSITAEELQQRFAEMNPTARARYQALDQKREYLEGLVRFELLAHEAQRRGLATDKDVRETAKKVMVQRLLQQELDEKATPPTDEELQAYFERHRSDYVRPEMIRLSHIFLATPSNQPDAVAETQKRAEGLLAQLQSTAPEDFRTFGMLAVKHSEEPRTRTLEGDMRYLSREELAAQYGAEVAAATDSLQQRGQLAPLVKTDRGFHILKLRSREPAVTQDVKSAKAQLVSRITHERRTQRYEAFLDSLRTQMKLKIDAAALERIPVDPTAPAKPADGPPPGFIPAPPRSVASSSPRVPSNDLRPPQNVVRPAPSASPPPGGP